jgi:hypothetical protein
MAARGIGQTVFRKSLFHPANIAAEVGGIAMPFEFLFQFVKLVQNCQNAPRNSYFHNGSQPQLKSAGWAALGVILAGLWSLVDVHAFFHHFLRFTIQRANLSPRVIGPV